MKQEDDFAKTMNFDLIARYYDKLEMLFADGVMQRCRIAFLDDTRDRRRALLIGEGTGQFLIELLRSNSQIQVVCIDKSAEMIARARRRLSLHKLDSTRVLFRQMDITDWQVAGEKFDLVVTHFFLDCFRASQLEKIVDSISQCTESGTIWLLADFRVPEHGWRRWRAKLLLSILYLFFKLVTSVSANWLTPPDRYLTGFDLIDRRIFNYGFAYADIWRRKVFEPV